MSIGIAEPPTPDIPCELTPITSPWALMSGPPALASSIAASVRIACSSATTFGGIDTVLDGADDAEGRGPVEAARVPDRDHRVADLHRVRVAQREWTERAGVGVDLEKRDVGGGVASDKGRAEVVAPGEPHVQARRAGDDSAARDDVPRLVDHEARAEGIAARSDGRAGAGDLHHAGRVEAVDLLDRQIPAGRASGGARRVGAAG